MILNSKSIMYLCVYKKIMYFKYNSLQNVVMTSYH